MAARRPSDPAIAQQDVDVRERPVARAILVVDDDPVVLGVIARILRHAGGEVSTASSGREALRQIADGRTRPAIVVTDIDMPEMSGVELAARVAALRPGIRIVMMTGDPASAAVARTHTDLVQSVVMKPVTVDELLQAVGWR